MMADPLLSFTGKTFAALLHTSFKVVRENEPALTLELAEVTERATSPDVELFIVVFRGPLAPRLQQKIHRLEHPVMGSFDLFLTAVGADHEGRSYEAVFNRLRKQKP